MAELLKYGKVHSELTILEGIMYEEWYSPLFKLANELYESNIYAYYFDISFEETLRRHSMRNKSQEFVKKLCAIGGEKKIFLLFLMNRSLLVKCRLMILLKEYIRIYLKACNSDDNTSDYESKGK